MARDVFTETERIGFGRRLGGSFKGIVIGLILAVVTVPLLFWNEGRAVKRDKTLREGQGIVVSIQPSETTPAHQGKLVHFSGRATTGETLRDEDFGISTKALRLIRTVEMYQWQEETRTETRTNAGGSQTRTTTYEYDTAWSGQVIPSNEFRHPEGHQNPGNVPFPSRSQSVADARVGRIRLPEDMIARIGVREAVPAQGAEVPGSDRPGRIAGDYVYYGEDPASPRVGDARVSFSLVPETAISVVARLEGDSVVAYRTEAGGSLYMLDDGTRTAEEMFASEQMANTVLAWVLRGVGFALMWIGLGALLGPMRVLADVIPLLGRLVGAGIGMVSGLLAVAISGITIAVAWLFYRPLIGIAVLALSAGALYWLGRRAKAVEPAAPPVHAQPPPPPPGSP